MAALKLDTGTISGGKINLQPQGGTAREREQARALVALARARGLVVRVGQQQYRPVVEVETTPPSGYYGRPKGTAFGRGTRFTSEAELTCIERMMIARGSHPRQIEGKSLTYVLALQAALKAGKSYEEAVAVAAATPEKRPDWA